MNSLASSKILQKDKNTFLDLKIKSNGHSVFQKTLPKPSIINEITYHLDKYKLPINVSVSEISFNQQGLGIDKSSVKDNIYDMSVLYEEIQLFETEKQITDYIAMEKLLAHDVEDKLTQLSKSLIELIKYRLSENNIEQILSIDKVEQTNITKEKLNDIQQKCMKILTRVQEERRKLQLCAICWDKPTSVILIPCMHLVLCKNCVPPKMCPLCKVPIQSSNVVYR